MYKIYFIAKLWNNNDTDHTELHRFFDDFYSKNT